MKTTSYYATLFIVALLLPCFLSAATFTVSSINDTGSGSLRDAVTGAIASPGQDTIIFDAGINGSTIVLTSGQIVLPADLYIKGNGPDYTIVDGNSSSRIFLIDDKDNVQIEGMTFQNGSASIGGAIMINFCSPSFFDCRFIDNEATNVGPNAQGGGAIFNNSVFAGPNPAKSSSPSFNDCSFLNNTAANRGGAIYNQGEVGISSPSFTNCQFENNRALGSTYGQGGAIFNNGSCMGDSSPSFSACEFTKNDAGTEGGAVFNLGRGGKSSPDFDNCSFVANEATGHGGALYDDGASVGGESSPSFTSSAFLGNKSGDKGGAAFNYGENGICSPKFVNTTFAGNNATSYAGTMLNSSTAGASDASFCNTISWGNASGIVDEFTAQAIYTYSLIQNVFPAGIGNLDGTDPLNDPQFQNPISAALAPSADGDYRLQVTSPLISQGSNACLEVSDTLDLDSNPRIMNGTVDMGAFEDCSIPLALCTNVTVLLDENFHAEITAESIDAGSFADCKIDTSFLNLSEFDCSDLGDRQVFLTVRDQAGKEDTCHATVTIEDDPANDLCCLDGETNNHYIQQVSEYMSGLSNPSGDDGGYGDYTGITFSSPSPYIQFMYFLFTPGGSYDLQNWEMYIDWNNNQQFEASEKMMDYCTAVPFVQFVNLAGRPNGLFRMRLIMQTDTDNDGCQAGELPADLCGPIGEGEVEDYMILKGFAAPLQNSDEDLVQNKNIQVFPNPFTDEFLVTVSDDKQKQSALNVEIELLTAQGQLILRRSEMTSGDPIHIDANQLSPGSYFLRINTGDGVQMKTIVKQ